MNAATAAVDPASVPNDSAEVCKLQSHGERRRQSTRGRNRLRRFFQLLLGADSEEIWAVGALTEADLRRFAWDGV